jgi:hypothetical protein
MVVGGMLLCWVGKMVGGRLNVSQGMSLCCCGGGVAKEGMLLGKDVAQEEVSLWYI